MAERTDDATLKEIDALFKVTASNLAPLEKYRVVAPYIEDSRQEICRSAIVALGNVHCAESVTMLRGFVDRGSHLDVVLSSLARLGDATIVPVCVSMMESGDSVQQFMAVSAIGDLSSEVAVPLLEEWWERDIGSEVRSAVALQLAKNKSVKSLAHLYQELQEHEVAWMSIVLAMSSVSGNIDSGRAKALVEVAQVMGRQFAERLFLVHAGVMLGPEAVWLEDIRKWVRALTSSKE